ncbi:hypothetical protein LX64_00494 [Chitinophaga skermanii]|uniref:MoxR-vWA-beta-propeller ternary system domain-containing protein n=1 Tax=Chitinophaga skermanii TaxID=331697 RepID=A0A327RAE5_9BACT|nr:hypothetical protein [Chitinophaga skermanii]RAJ10887.1 hypothetical protein LX64_00494 [Chitinophaga skermanii]
MKLLAFTQTLLGSGRAIVASHIQTYSMDDEHATVEYLSKHYDRLKLALPGNPPIFDRGAALWATKIMYRAAQCALIQHWSKEEINALLPDYNNSIHPSSIVSADLVLRHLPKVMHAMQDLPAKDRLLAIAHAWPLSSVGIELPKPIDATLILEHDTLRGMYIDRIIATQNVTLLQPSKKPWISAMIADESTLPPKMQKRIRLYQLCKKRTK